MPTLKSSDVKFTLSNGNVYNFMLARTSEGKKAWNVSRLYTKPPSLIKHQIDITITAREDEMTSTAVRQLKRVREILDEVDVMMSETENLTLHGLDNIDYPASLDSKGMKLETVIHEQERDPEYQITLLVWGLYE